MPAGVKCNRITAAEEAGDWHCRETEFVDERTFSVGIDESDDGTLTEALRHLVHDWSIML